LSEPARRGNATSPGALWYRSVLTFPLCVTVLFGSLASIGAARQSDDSCSIPSAVPVGVSLRSLAQARKILIGAALNEWALVHDNT